MNLFLTLLVLLFSTNANVFAMDPDKMPGLPGLGSEAKEYAGPAVPQQGVGHHHVDDGPVLGPVDDPSNTVLHHFNDAMPQQYYAEPAPESSGFSGDGHWTQPPMSEVPYVDPVVMQGAPSFGSYELPALPDFSAPTPPVLPTFNLQEALHPPETMPPMHLPPSEGVSQAGFAAPLMMMAQVQQQKAAADQDLKESKDRASTYKSEAEAFKSQGDTLRDHTATLKKATESMQKKIGELQQAMQNMDSADVPSLTDQDLDAIFGSDPAMKAAYSQLTGEISKLQQEVKSQRVASQKTVQKTVQEGKKHALTLPPDSTPSSVPARAATRNVTPAELTASRQCVHDTLAGKNIEARVEAAQNLEHQINRLNEQSSDRLPGMSLQQEQAAGDAIRASNAMAHEAAELAGDTTQVSSVRLLTDFATDLAMSTSRFLGGVYSGSLDAISGTVDVARAIYNDPALLGHLSTNIMNTLSAGPGAVGSALLHGANHLGDAINQFQTTLSYGSPAQVGHALGELGTNVLLGALGTEALQGAGALIGGMMPNLAAAGATEVLGTRFMQQAHPVPGIFPGAVPLAGEAAAATEEAIRRGLVEAARREGFTRVQFPRGAGAARGAVPEGYVPVSRWVSEGEARLWREGGGTHIPPEAGTLVEPGNLRLYVTNPGAPRPGNAGPIRVDFYVPGSMVRGAGNAEWRQIVQPVANTPIYNVQINLP